MNLPPMETSGGTKENSGARRRQRYFCRVGLWILLSLLAYNVLWKYWLAGVNVPDREIGADGKERIRRRPDQLVKMHPQTGEEFPTSPFDAILEGHLTLVSISIPTTGLRSDGTKHKKYSNVKASFCAISWDLQQSDPSKVPMFRDLQTQSRMCKSTMYTVNDLHDLTRQVRDYHMGNHTFAAPEPKGRGTKRSTSVPPSAVVFHQTRCGSTLVSNLLSTVNSNSRVYSESPPPVTALRACDGGTFCEEGAQDALIRDVFYMMGRVPPSTAAASAAAPPHVFYKIQSIGVQQVSAFTRALPNTPWMFVYRNPVEIMMSHFKNYLHGQALSKKARPVCLRNYGYSIQNPVLVELVESQGLKVADLTQEEYCAAHLASLASFAVTEYEADEEGDSETPVWFVNYEALPHVMWETILPDLLHVPKLDMAIIEKMQQVAHAYSKGRDGAASDWKEDSARKQDMAPDVVKEAAATFLNSLYEKMLAISNGDA